MYLSIAHRITPWGWRWGWGWCQCAPNAPKVRMLAMSQVSVVADWTTHETTRPGSPLDPRSMLESIMHLHCKRDQRSQCRADGMQNTIAMAHAHFAISSSPRANSPATSDIAIAIPTIAHPAIRHPMRPSPFPGRPGGTPHLAPQSAPCRRSGFKLFRELRQRWS